MKQSCGGVLVEGEKIKVGVQFDAYGHELKRRGGEIREVGGLGQ